MRHRPYGPYEKYIKRPLDCVLAACALLILSPLLGVVALLVRVKLGAPVIFRQERPGRNERIFRLYKFRTMTDARDEKGELLSDSKRLTKIGSVLRRTSLDELPELINILKGDMSFIGPRPLLVKYLPYYTEREKRRHEVRPGLSGLAQVSGRNYIGWNKRLELDVQYVDKITFVGDLKIIVQTIKNVLWQKDVAVDTDAVEPALDAERKN